MGLLETMKRVAQATSDAGMPTAFLFGSVTKTSPLTIRVDNRFDISGDAIVVMKEFQAGFYPTHYHTGVKGSPSTEEKSGGSGDASFAAHSPHLERQLLDQHRRKVRILLRPGPSVTKWSFCEMLADRRSLSWEGCDFTDTERVKRNDRRRRGGSDRRRSADKNIQNRL
ncbi:MAG: DUF2577 family protein [Dysosmobacter welbionis]